jgi:hypothetical protein
MVKMMNQKIKSLKDMQYYQNMKEINKKKYSRRNRKENT